AARNDGRDDDDASDIWVTSAEGGEPHRLTDTSGPVGWPSFSPDGLTVAYIARRAINDFGRNMQVFSVGAAGGKPTCLTADLDRLCGPLGVKPLWSPHWRWLAVAAEGRGGPAVYLGQAPGGAAPRTSVRGGRL